MNYYIITTTYTTYNQFLRPVAKELSSRGYEVTVLCRNVEGNEEPNTAIKIQDISFSRRLFKLSNLRALIQIKLYFKTKRGIINVHTPIASAITRIALMGSNIPIIYTAHGFHFHRDQNSMSNRIYFLVERFLSKYTNKLITINRQDYDVATRLLKAKSTDYLPGIGFNSNVLNRRQNNSKIRNELNIKEDEIVILSIGELNKNKNHKLVIDFFIENKDLSAIRYLICGVGPLQTKLKQLVHESGLQDKVLFLGYRTDIASIIMESNIFAFPSFREGLPVSLMEAINFEKDVIAFNIRGNEDLIPVEYHKDFLVSPYHKESFHDLLKTKITKWKNGVPNLTSADWVVQNRLDNILPKYIELITNI